LDVWILCPPLFKSSYELAVSKSADFVIGECLEPIVFKPNPGCELATK
ncbi:hypothetical protein AVEN_201431-1, partial [Araneus ventricosus]